MALAWVMLFSGQARAQSNAERDARAAYESGLAHFRRGEYPDAIRDLERAYQSYPAPELLYNVAQAARLQGDCIKALDFYARFLAADPTEPLLSRAAARLADMERCVQRRAALAAEASPHPSPGAVAVAPEPSVEHARRASSAPERRRADSPAVEERVSLPLVLTLGGVAVGSFAAGGIALARYFDKNSQAKRLCPNPPPDFCSERDAAHHDELTREARSARPWVYAGFGAGVAASAALVAVIVWPRGASDASARALTFQPGFDSGGAELRASLQW